MPKNNDISGYQLWVDYEKKGLSKVSVYLPTKVEERIMTKYIGAVVRKSSQLQILAEIDHFEKFGRV